MDTARKEFFKCNFKPYIGIPFGWLTSEFSSECNGNYPNVIHHNFLVLPMELSSIKGNLE